MTSDKAVEDAIDTLRECFDENMLENYLPEIRVKMRAALDAASAASPPRAEDLDVTKEMIRSGMAAWDNWADNDFGKDAGQNGVIAIYLAMRAKEPPSDEDDYKSLNENARRHCSVLSAEVERLTKERDDLQKEKDERPWIEKQRGNIMRQLEIKAFGWQCEVNRAQEEKFLAEASAKSAEAALAEMREAIIKAETSLENLYALVLGECPSLLNEDSGGSAYLDQNCREALRALRALIDKG